MALVLISYRRRRKRRPYKERVYKTRFNFLGMADDQVVRLYRLNTEAIRDLCEVLKTDLESATFRSHALPVHVKVTAALNFYALGTFQTPAGDAAGISQSSMSRCVSQVTAALVRRANGYIRFPTSRQQQQRVKQEFYLKAGFPNVLGAVDCMHVALRPPADHEDRFRNRKQFHSMNMQVVCDANCRITHVVANFPGSAQDSYVLNHSSLRDIFEIREGMEGWLLGDSSYDLKPWLMTPISNPLSPAELRYNDAHHTTHSAIDKTFRILKARFRCLAHSRGVLQYSPQKVCHIFVACCVLHNIANLRGIDVSDEEVDMNEGEEEEQEEEEDYFHEDSLDGIDEAVEDAWLIRTQLVRNFFG
ncbi:putative nuclease HARBI1 [Latimeria chalumnae]|uniref:putative nuclease HARBI1 n=1 Tax=Latimeria chalumnae TaxID=7897 RepID=UPI0003C19970|nr:PREDICTED: putative nuclease HARBI1 [Latimeria chalumnae]XP_005994812.1 PREDICTED: putative nuclease HARBI1 [Latimeria chalumnae]XP_005994813.1 PREDICTED: putative nuclease HARBI1 [Latimeria chalumnae]XP_014343116.1 PREDICTED: putative nuclease HARBI1 [Latimeria chalumnae]|eukprot:XP_005994811.1 PREDICTED: putative nuclease HARBI1 [Latimeria chalumnae]